MSWATDLYRPQRASRRSSMESQWKTAVAIGGDPGARPDVRSLAGTVLATGGERFVPLHTREVAGSIPAAPIRREVGG
jgi:hypothetical protein